ncbi:hypothetical protein AGLY_011525 [Aphis glycines]|uniref:Transposable element P transposase-like RNase H C-terminal domain-containing protein n=1 Tax=Aphis glycines TaxID=307491 RepID=A0A6G0TCD1_APHGL|nr:hypothetical protein AGLY_011525 [Aphis glycines]
MEKKALCNKNINDCKIFIHNFSNYKILSFLMVNLVINSNRKTRFLGFLMCLNFKFVIIFEKELIESNCLKFLLCYKRSQDHLELFDGAIRSHQGFNNNPTARQLRAAYLKFLIHAEIKQGGIGNCIPLEDIDILVNSSSSIKESYYEKINKTNCTISFVITNINYVNDIECEIETYFLKDHDYIINNNSFSHFSYEIIIYISGFVSHKLTTLIGKKENFLKSLINLKDNGGLVYPSNDVINICVQTEKTMRTLSLNNLKNLNKLHIQNKTLSFFLKFLIMYSFKMKMIYLLTILYLLLIKSIISCYYDLKMNYM